MQERTLYQEIVKQCMIQERHDALLESDKEKGIERTEEKLLEELEKIKEKCHAVTAARKVQTLIEDYPHHTYSSKEAAKACLCGGIAAKYKIFY